MNIKVVIVWGLFILLFAGIGIFGFLNQDLLVEDKQDPDVYIPSDIGNTSSKTCNATTPNGVSAYRFQLNNETQSIDKVIMTYTSNVEDLDGYTAATNINNSNIPGVSVALSGATNNFMLMVTVDLNTYDQTMISSIQVDLTKLAMVVDTSTDYEIYKALITSANPGVSYICD